MENNPESHDSKSPSGAFGDSRLMAASVGSPDFGLSQVSSVVLPSAVQRSKKARSKWTSSKAGGEF